MGPVASDELEKTKLGLVMAVSFTSSLFLGLFLALFVEWLSEVRGRHQEV